jgi:hypothetical protein
VRSDIAPPIEVNDPSESVRSDEIPGFLRDFFRIFEWRAYGGQVTDLVMPNLRSDWAGSHEGQRFVQSMLDIEDYELERDAASSHHLVAFGTLKSLPLLARPLSRQAVAAARRRLSALLARRRSAEVGE